MIKVSLPADDDDSSESDPRATLRWGIYLLLSAIALGGITGRILAVNSVDTVRLEKHLNDQAKKDGGKQRELQRPFLSANDRSRWCTVRALVEHGTYQIDQIVNQPNWDTIDMVKHDDEGRAAFEADKGHLYSSKPPLLATLMAGEYWVIHKVTGHTLGTHPYTIGRFMLVTLNVIPLAIYFWLLAGVVERFGKTDWGRIYVMACATLGTFLTTFAVVITNHLPAAVSAMVTLAAVVSIWYGDRRGWLMFFIAGLASAFTAACELPALSFTALITAALLWRAPRQALPGYMPGALIVAAGFFGTNYLAHGTPIVPYAYRSDADPEKNWYRYEYLRGGATKQSYWMDRSKRGPVDQGEPELSNYIFHALIGHHGIFSLSPIWLLSFVGLGMMCLQRDGPRALGAAVLVITVVCLAFYLGYLARNLDDRNYGGTTSGFRWVFWFAPLWLVAMLPAADAAAGRRWTRWLAALLLAASVLSVSYPTWNPWVHPWLTDYLLYLDAVHLGG